MVITPVENTSFFSPKHFTLKAEHSRSLALSVFFEGNKTETEEESTKAKLLNLFEIADLSHASQVLQLIHGSYTPVPSVEQQYDLGPPLFKLHRIFII